MSNTESFIGYVAGDITAPAAQEPVSQTPHGNSLIGYAGGVITAPGAVLRSNSQIGYASKQITIPHHPVVILTPSGLHNIPIYMWNGTSLQPPV